MILTKRETHIAVVTGVLVVLMLGYFAAVKPYMDTREQIATDRATTQASLQKLQALFQQQKKMQKILAELNAGGLSNPPAEAEGQLQNALFEWSRHSGITVASLRPEHSNPDGKFLQISFHLTGNGPLRTMAELLWRIETTSMPLRVNSLQITPRTDGEDDLQLQLEVSTLCLLPEADKSNSSRQNAGGNGGNRL